jgi:hypothetical protein
LIKEGFFLVGVVFAILTALRKMEDGFLLLYNFKGQVLHANSDPPAVYIPFSRLGRLNILFSYRYLLLKTIRNY